MNELKKELQSSWFNNSKQRAVLEWARLFEVLQIDKIKNPKVEKRLMEVLKNMA